VATAGCAVAYQPLSGLHTPSVVDPTHPNLRGVRVTLACTSDAVAARESARRLCERVEQLFEVQGAAVDLRDQGPAPIGGAADPALPPTDAHLLVALHEDRPQRDAHPLTLAASVLTATLAPWMQEQRIGQSVTVRDASGVLLRSDAFEARVVTSTGVAVWAGNALADRLWRPDEQQVTRDAAWKQLSGDLYQQLSQIVYDAAVQQRLRQEAAARQVPRGGP
jgi:hypothetical protein